MNVKIVKYLVEKGADLNIQKWSNGFTPLHYAAYYGHSTIVKILTEAGADTEIKDDDGYTPLDYAEQYDFEEVIRILKKNRVEVLDPAE